MAEQLGKPICHLAIRNNDGSVEHYYHFLLGYLLPLCTYLSQQSEEREVLLVRECGPLNRLIHELQIPELLLCERRSHADFPRSFNGSIHFEQTEIGGVDIGCAKPVYDLEALARVVREGVRYVRGRLGPSIEAHCRCLEAEWQASPRLLVVERCSPDPYYNSCLAEIKGGGTSRREITNIAELLAALTAAFGQIRHATLENLSLAEQIALFETADAVVAQHGAGLSNIVWMGRGAHVVEFIQCPEMKRHFGDLSSVLGIRHHFLERGETRDPVDVRELIECLTTNVPPGNSITSKQSNREP